MDGAILEWDHAFSETLECANCSLDAIVWVACKGDLMAPIRPIRDIKCQTEQLNFTKRELISELRVSFLKGQSD